MTDHPAVSTKYESRVTIGQGKVSLRVSDAHDYAAYPDKSVINATAALHRALWREHPRIMFHLGAVPCKTK